MKCICLVPCLLPQSICAPGTVCCVQSPLMHHAAIPAVHMPACLLSSCAWSRQSISGVQQLWNTCSFLGPQVPLSCVTADALQGAVPSCPQDQQVTPSSKDARACSKEQHSGGHWSSENSLLLLDLPKWGFWMCPSDRTDSHPCPPCTPHILSLALLVITFITIIKYCAILQGCIFTEIQSIW